MKENNGFGVLLSSLFSSNFVNYGLRLEILVKLHVSQRIVCVVSGTQEQLVQMQWRWKP
jgi:hypothetical protein